MAAEINYSNNSNQGPKKRVLFIITQSEMGGAQRFLYTLLVRISGRYDIRVATGSDGGGELVKKLNNLNIETSTLGSLKRDIGLVNDFRSCFEMKRLIQDFRPHTLFLLSSKAGFLGSFVSRFMIDNPSFKTIYRIGGWSFNDPGSSQKKTFLRIMEKLSAPWKDITIVNNAHDFKQAEKYNIKPREKTILIHNGIDIYKLDFMEPTEARLKLFERLSKQSGKIFSVKVIIGTIANFYPAKGLKTLIEAAEHFKNNDDVAFCVIGSGQEIKLLEKLIKEKGLEKKLFLLGQIPDARRYLPAFDVFVLPSLKEGFPWVLIEAMAAKLPVVATRVGAVPEIIEDGKNGFIVEPDNSATLADKIKELITNDHLYKEFSIQGHQTVLFKFSEDKMVKEIEALL